MKGILIVAHGSKAKETEATLEAVLDMVRDKSPGICMEYAFMEFSDKTIRSGVEALIEKGVSEIKIVPYFLFAGVHIKEDIPAMAQECMKQNPNVQIGMGGTLGADERLADILVDRINEA